MLGARDWLGALASIERALARSPGDATLYRLRVLTLSDIGSSHRAWALYRARPELFEAGERARLEAALVARAINWSRLYVAHESGRLAAAESAAKQLAEFRSMPVADAAASTHVDFDELILLNRLNRHGEVVRRYRQMLAQGRSVPAYALAAVGDSLLAERAPHEAVVALSTVVEHDPTDHDAAVQLAYAHIESERFDSALAMLEKLLAQQPAWPKAPGARRGHENRFRLDVETAYGLVRAYGEDLAGAQATLEPLASTAPNNAQLQSSLGTVYLLRGWPRAALERFRIAATLDNLNISPMLGQVAALSELGRFDEARPIRSRLLDSHGSEVRVQDMERRWRLAQDPSARIHAAAGDGRDGAAPLGSRDFEYGIEVRGPLLADRWRVLARSEHRGAEFSDQSVRVHRNDVGINYAYRGLAAEALAGRASDGVGGTAASLAFGRHYGDRWNAGVVLRRNDLDASLQARAAGITADSARITMAYERHEAAGVAFGLQRSHYDDGNRRDGFDVSANQRWISEPHLLVTGLLDIDASRGTREDAPYFNPERVASLDLGIDIDRIGWRHYDRHFRHRLLATAGLHWQQNFGSDWVPAVRYGHEWQLTPSRVLQYGVSWSRPVYDGQRETRVAVDMEVRWGR
ncbi:poly-beta-1,6 N-acetyl-D-glucosamine export porin PgaA [Cognatilysobacter bugurensis]|uniref:PgaA membrane beta barrel domain-containing protein n=1 Tax=Cognatilysobacter bugurensis TaxID=543356 RepID=A0A918SX71_9GAMM|nr:poly-beta-1,6 N-acetyl-D-glucosamine export porin PgaA [Lysobacter bugurensis]GHA73554.1 hypothetical protein GCM10007067_07900 [Lysobacter bugurensis]